MSASGGTSDADAASLADRVAAAVARHRGDTSVIRCERNLLGTSGYTHDIDVATAGGTVSLIVRSVPPGRAAIGRHDVSAQAYVLSYLAGHGDVPVPAVAACSNEPPAFYAMERAVGLISEPIFDRSHPRDAGETAAAWHRVTTVLARLHQVPVDTLEVPPDRRLGIDDELAKWTATMAAADMLQDPAVARLRSSLSDDPPTPRPPCLTHGDLRLGNVVEHNGAITAVLDWEIWALGDPRSDLAWLQLFVDPTSFPHLGRPIAGVPPAGLVAEWYGDELEEMAWFQALACFKGAAIGFLQLARAARHDAPDALPGGLGSACHDLVSRGIAALAAGPGT
ncbi:MAG: phosphotransferase family protein [Desertimonas sp.]